MEIPRHLQDLVDRLGQALVQALANDAASRELAKKIQTEGFDIALMLEATVALRRREEGAGVPEGLLFPQARQDGEEENEPFSEEDRAFLRTFKIALE